MTGAFQTLPLRVGIYSGFFVSSGFGLIGRPRGTGGRSTLWPRGGGEGGAGWPASRCFTGAGGGGGGGGDVGRSRPRSWTAGGCPGGCPARRRCWSFVASPVSLRVCVGNRRGAVGRSRRRSMVGGGGAEGGVGCSRRRSTLGAGAGVAGGAPTRRRSSVVGWTAGASVGRIRCRESSVCGGPLSPGWPRDLGEQARASAEPAARAAGRSREAVDPTKKEPTGR